MNSFAGTIFLRALPPSMARYSKVGVISTSNSCAPKFVGKSSVSRESLGGRGWRHVASENEDLLLLFKMESENRIILDEVWGRFRFDPVSFSGIIGVRLRWVGRLGWMLTRWSNLKIKKIVKNSWAVLFGECCLVCWKTLFGWFSNLRYKYMVGFFSELCAILAD